MPDAREFRDAVLADRVDVVEQWLRGGIDADMPLDERGATPLFFACTPGMVRALLNGGAEAMRVLADGVSVLDAAAQEGQVGIQDNVAESRGRDLVKMVAARDAGERCARPEGRRLQAA